MEIENVHGKEGRPIKMLYEAFEEIFEIPNIMKKIEDGKELTQEETEKILRYIEKKASAIKNKRYNLLPIDGVISFKLLSIIGEIGGKKTEAIARSAETVANLPKDIADNTDEVLKGVRITRDNICLENISILLQQYKTTEDHLKDALTVMEKISERLGSSERDYETPIAEETQNNMRQAKKKVKSLGQEYQRNEGKK